MNILSFVTNEESKFYEQQIEGLRTRGHTVDVVAVPGPRITGGVDTGRRSKRVYVQHYLRSIAAARRSYDVVHANYGLTAPPAIAQPFHPVVLTLWGSDVMGEYGWLTKICSRFADAVVVMSDEMGQRLDCDYQVIPHGIDLELFQPVPKQWARAHLGWDQSVHQALFPYGPSRDVKDYPRAERIVEMARDGVDGEIELQTVTGEPHGRMPIYMSAADCMLLTSKREGLPNSVKEAMACDLPVVSVDVGAVSTLLDADGHSTVGTDDEFLADALAETLRADERSNGSDLIVDLSLERQLDRLESVYRSVTNP